MTKKDSNWLLGEHEINEENNNSNWLINSNKQQSNEEILTRGCLEALAAVGGFFLFGALFITQCSDSKKTTTNKYNKQTIDTLQTIYLPGTDIVDSYIIEEKNIFQHPLNDDITVTVNRFQSRDSESRTIYKYEAVYSFTGESFQSVEYENLFMKDGHDDATAQKVFSNAQKDAEAYKSLFFK